MPDVNMPETESQASHTTPSAEPRSPKRRGGLWITLAVLLVAVCGGAAWWFQSRPAPQAKAESPMPVPVITVTGRTVPVYRSFPALTQAVRTVVIQARVAGYLTDQGAADGADVLAGALLYRIDAKDYQAAFAQARATVGQAAASLDYSRVTNGRNQVLARAGWVSRDTADQTSSNFHQGEATRANTAAALQEAALNLSRTEIRAPFAGRLSASQVFKGTLISVAGATLNTLIQLDPIYVSFNPAEGNLDAITREQTRAPIDTAVSGSGRAPGHSGKLTFIDNQVSLTTGTILMRATIANPDHALLPGRYVMAKLHLGDLHDALLVPQSAVGASQIGQTLMIVGKDSKVEQRIVKLGDSYGDMTVVTDGLKPGDRVITGQLQKLKPGEAVKPASDQHSESGSG